MLFQQLINKVKQSLVLNSVQEFYYLFLVFFHYITLLWFLPNVLYKKTGSGNIQKYFQQLHTFLASVFVDTILLHFSEIVQVQINILADQIKKLTVSFLTLSVSNKNQNRLISTFLRSQIYAGTTYCKLH